MAVDDQYTKSLLHFDGNFTDESGKIWTAYGGATTSSTQSKFGGRALYLDGVDDYLLIDSSVPDFEFGANDFTIDAWVYPYAGKRLEITNCGGVEMSVYPSHRLYVEADGILVYDVWNEGSTRYVNCRSGTALSMGTWSHVAISRSGSTFRLFANGIVVSTATWTGSIVNDYMMIGWQKNETSRSQGYIDELRISKGIARWTANFTPPTAPYGGTIRLCQAIGGF